MDGTGSGRRAAVIAELPRGVGPPASRTFSNGHDPRYASARSTAAEDLRKFARPEGSASEIAAFVHELGR
jgi:hypothetical protein